MDGATSLRKICERLSSQTLQVKLSTSDLDLSQVGKGHLEQTNPGGRAEMDLQLTTLQYGSKTLHLPQMFRLNNQTSI